MRRSLASAVALGALALALPSGALAAGPPANAQCTVTLPPGTYENVNVPSTGDCTLSDVRILGNLTVDSNGSVYLAYDGAAPISGTIDGNALVGSGASYFEDEGWVVKGTTAVNGATDLDIDGTAHNVVAQGVEDTNFYDATIDGNFVSNQSAGYGSIYTSTITGNLAVNGSAGDPNFGGSGSWDISGPQTVGGSVLITNNQVPTDIDTTTIRQNLVCTGNTPPTVNFANTVGGRSVGQCATPTTGDAASKAPAP